MSTLDQAMNYIADALAPPQHIDVTPSHGSSYSSWGGCGYWVYGKVVILHFGLSGITKSTTKTVYTMPAGLRPSKSIPVMGGGQTTADQSTWTVGTNGSVSVYTTSGYANMTVTYIVQ